MLYVTECISLGRIKKGKKLTEVIQYNFHNIKQKEVNVMILKKNIGYLDSILRVFGGALIVAFGLYFNSYWGFIGLIPVVSGAVSFCPIYKILNTTTISPDLEREN